MKKVYICKVCQDIHVGLKAPQICPTCQQQDAYDEADSAKALDLLPKLTNKRFGRCFVCNDLHYGTLWPSPCPTCIQDDSYVEIEQSEFEKVINILS